MTPTAEESRWMRRARVPRRLLALGAVVSVVAGTLAGLTLAAPAAEAVVSGAQAWQAGDPTFTAPAKRTAITGVQYHGLWSDYTDTTRGQILDSMAAAGVKHVRLDVAWAQIQPNLPTAANGGFDLGWAVPRIDSRLKEITDRGMKALMVFYWAPQWSTGTAEKNGVPRSASEYGDAAAWAADRWEASLAGMELWNEPDLPEFLANTSVVTYTNLIKDAYPKIKSAAASVTVVAGAPTYIKTSWYQGFYANGGADHYDALGIHPYIGVADQAVSACDAQYVEYYPCNLPNLVKLMADNGDSDKKIWATEYGWSSHDESSYAAPVPNWKRGVTEAEQASNLLAMQNLLGQYPQVEASYWYNDWNKATGDQHEDNWGLLRRDFTPKPAYFAMKCVASGICGSPTPTPTPTSSPYVAKGANWRYSDTGTNLGSAWRGTSYSDSTWRSGRAQLGFGDGDEATVLRWGTNAAKKYMTSYFRTTFDAGSSTTGVTGLTLEALVDDGAVVYLNGTEVWRWNMPTGSIGFSTKASTNVSGAAETTWRTVSLPKSALKAGTNVLAVEVHQDSASSSDLSMDLALTPKL